MIQVDQSGMYDQTTVPLRRRSRIGRARKFAKELPKWYGLFKGNNFFVRVWLVFLMFKIVMK